MMTKKHSGLKVNKGLLMILPVIAVLLLLIPGCSQKDKPADAGTEAAPPPPPPPPPAAMTGPEIPYEEVDEMPVFKGGDAALLKYIGANTNYPEAAKARGIQGKVLVRFAVEADGSVARISIFKGVDPELDKESLRVVSTLPAFEKPGVKDGKPVSVWYTLPIKYALR
jgi:protein TonB